MPRGPLIYDVTFSVKCTSDQKLDMSRAATVVGQTQGTFIRSAILKEVRRVLRSQVVHYDAERA